MTRAEKQVARRTSEEGRGMSRAERARVAAELRAGGLIYREIAERMGVGVSYAHELVTDPEGLRVAARKRSYCGECVDCGGLTNGHDGIAAAPARCGHCNRCGQHEGRRWTPDAIAGAMRRWGREHGQPPTATQWRNAGEDHPAASTVVNEVGWNDALRLAGLPVQQEFASPARHDPAVKGLAARLYREGSTTDEVAERFGVSPSRVYQWLSSVGQPRRAPWESRRLREAA